MKKDTIIRTVLLVLALFNQLLAIFGKEALPFGEEALYQGISGCITVVSSLVSWWKNNSFTKEAILADQLLHDLKEASHD